MPCIVYDDEHKNHPKGESPIITKLRDERRTARRRANRATKLLCMVCRRLEQASGHIKLAKEILEDPELKAWWEEHKKEDEKRRKREEEKRKKAERKRKRREEKKKLKESALSKLSKKEREALGL